MMGTGMDAVSAADTEVMIYNYLLSRAAIAVFYGTRCNTGMAVDAFFLIYPDNRG
jgi:hypothetical protein